MFVEFRKPYPLARLGRRYRGAAPRRVCEAAFDLYVAGRLSPKVMLRAEALFMTKRDVPEPPKKAKWIARP